MYLQIVLRTSLAHFRRDMKQVWKNLVVGSFLFVGRTINWVMSALRVCRVPSFLPSKLTASESTTLKVFPTKVKLVGKTRST